MTDHALFDRRHQYVPVPAERRGAIWGWVAYFSLLTAFFSCVALWLLSRHYLNDGALWAWSTVVGSLDAPEGGFNRFVLLYPQVQYYLLTVLSVIPGLRLGQPWPMIAAIVVVIALNPIFLWSATNGGGEMIGVTLYYVLGLSMIVLRYSHSLHSHILLGLVLLLFFIADARSLYVAITLLPLLPLVVQKHILRLNPVAPILVLYLPLLFMIGIWLALNWIYTGDALAFLKDPASPFLGARISADYLPWRAAFGQEFWPATFISAVLLLVCYPALVLVQFAPLRRSRAYAAGLALAGMPVFASGLATWAEFTQSPADILVFAIGGVMALLTTGMLQRERPLTLIALLAAGMIGSVALFQKYPGVGMEGWFDAIDGRTVESPKRGDLELGLWARGETGVMIDENTAYAVIAARGEAKGLYLTFSDMFKKAVNSGVPEAAWIAVPSPLRDRERRDQIARNFPKLYEEGLPGYVLVYDRSEWRVYASADQWREKQHYRSRPVRESDGQL